MTLSANPFIFFLIFVTLRLINDFDDTFDPDLKRGRFNEISISSSDWDLEKLEVEVKSNLPPVAVEFKKASEDRLETVKFENKTNKKRGKKKNLRLRKQNKTNEKRKKDKQTDLKKKKEQSCLTCLDFRLPKSVIMRSSTRRLRPQLLTIWEVRICHVFHQ